MIANADFVVGQPVDGEIAPELSMGEVATAELAALMGVRLDLVGEAAPSSPPCLPSLPGRHPAFNGVSQTAV